MEVVVLKIISLVLIWDAPDYVLLIERNSVQNSRCTTLPFVEGESDVFLIASLCVNRVSSSGH